MVLLIFILALGTFAADLTQVSITADTKLIQATTNYHFSFKYSTSLSSSSKFRITFPSVFTSLTQGIASCSVQTLQSSCTPSCSFQNNYFYVTNCFPPQSTNVVIDVNNVINPISTTSGTFVINTLNSADTVLDQGSVSVSFTAADMASAVLLPGTQIVGDYSTWQITLQTAYTIPAGGLIYVTFPTWSQGMGSTAPTLSYCSGSQVCTGITSKK